MHVTNKRSTSKADFSMQISKNNSNAPLTGILYFTKSQIAVKQISITAKSEKEKFQRIFKNPIAERNIPLLGFKFGEKYEIEAVAEFVDGEKNIENFTLQMPEMAQDPNEFPDLEIKIGGCPEPGWIMFNPCRQVPTDMNEKERTTIDAAALNYGMLIILDEKGEIVWYYKCDNRLTYSLIKNDRIYYGTAANIIYEIDFFGNVTASWCPKHRPNGKPVPKNSIAVESETFHHQFLLLNNGNILALSTQEREIDNFYTSEDDINAPRAKQSVIGDVIVEFERNGKVVWQWNAFDYLDTNRIGYETFVKYWGRRGYSMEARDWSHFNGLYDLPEENALIVNSRLQSAVFKIDKRSGEIIWIFGDPQGWGEKYHGKLFNLVEGNWPWQQHAPYINSKGQLTLFNNDNYQAWSFSPKTAPKDTDSRAVAYELDEKNMIAKQVWNGSIPNEQAVCSTAMGSMEPLKGENVLVNYGMLLDNTYIDEITWDKREKYPTWTMIRELTSSTPPQVAIEIKLIPKKGAVVGWQSFGAVKVYEIPGRNFDGSVHE